jgi:hypothetical protein
MTIRPADQFALAEQLIKGDACSIRSAVSRAHFAVINTLFELYPSLLASSRIADQEPQHVRAVSDLATQYATLGDERRLVERFVENLRITLQDWVTADYLLNRAVSPRSAQTALMHAQAALTFAEQIKSLRQPPPSI